MAVMAEEVEEKVEREAVKEVEAVKVEEKEKVEATVDLEAAMVAVRLYWPNYWQAHHRVRQTRHHQSKQTFLETPSLHETFPLQSSSHTAVKKRHQLN